MLLLRRGHPLARKLRDRAALQALDFVLVTTHVEPARALHLLGLESRIRLTLPHFSVVPAILETTDFAVVLPLRPALRYAARRALQVVEPDLGLPPFAVAVHWTWRHKHDTGHRWLREVVARMRFAPMHAERGAGRRLTSRAASASAAAASRTRARSGR